MVNQLLSLCSASESPKPSGGGRMGTMKEAFKAQYLSKFRKSSDSIGTTSNVGSGGVQSSMQEQCFRRFSFYFHNCAFQQMLMQHCIADLSV